MKKIARYHHHVPQFYLAGFTNTGDKHGKIFGFDKTIQNNPFITSIKRIGGEKDFNRIDIPGHAPDAFENAISGFETLAAPVLKELIKTSLLPKDEAFITLMNFFALLIVRNPKSRKMHKSFLEEMHSHVGHILVSKKEIWESHLKGIKRLQKHKIENVSYENMKDFIENKKYDLVIPNETNILKEISLIDVVLPCLVNRKWALAFPENDNEFFITSDHPLTLYWQSPKFRGPVGFGLKNTEILIPINSNCAMVGAFEDIPEYFFGSSFFVAEANFRTINNAQRQFYSPKMKYLTMNNNGKPVFKGTCV